MFAKAKAVWGNMVIKKYVAAESTIPCHHHCFARTTMSRSKHNLKVSKRINRLKLKNWPASPKEVYRRDDIAISQSGATGVKLENDQHYDLRHVIASEWKGHIYNVLQSGKYGVNMSALIITKLEMSPNAANLQVYWKPTANPAIDEKTEAYIEKITPDITSQLEEEVPQWKQPSVRFIMDQMSDGHNVMNLMDQVKQDINKFDSSDTTSSDQAAHSKPIKLISDVYGVDRQAIANSISSDRCDSLTSFGAVDVTDIEFDPYRGSPSISKIVKR